MYKNLWRWLTATALTLGAMSGATIWNESVNGKLSSNQNAPTNIGAVGVGDNLVTGSLVNTNDAFIFTLPSGDTLAAITVTGLTGTTNAPNFYFLKGSTFSGGTLVGALNFTNGNVHVGSNLLSILGSGPESTSGVYEIVLAGAGENITAFTLNFQVTSAVTAAPEPAGIALLGLGGGIVGLAARIRRSRSSC